MGVSQHAVAIGQVWPFQTASFSQELGATDLLHLANFPVLFPVAAATHRARTQTTASVKGRSREGCGGGRSRRVHRGAMTPAIYSCQTAALSPAVAVWLTRAKTLKQQTVISLWFPCERLNPESDSLCQRFQPESRENQKVLLLCASHACPSPLA